MLTLEDGASLFPAAPARLAGAPLAVLAGNRASHAQALAEILAEAL